jgi:hypothetical protein
LKVVPRLRMGTARTDPGDQAQLLPADTGRTITLWEAPFPSASRVSPIERITGP